ncbi:copper-binding protein [Leptolyngbya sp. 15MV]|nr:copper-binding protein [Leptolyngbya sp. 15MV]
MSIVDPPIRPSNQRAAPARIGRAHTVTVAALLAIPLALTPLGCERRSDSTSSAPPASPQRGPADQVYTVRGQIVALPDPTKPASQLQIHHEEIPNFVGAQGTVVGMKEMTMPFPLAPGVSLEGLAVGDKVEFTFDVWLKPRMTYHLSKIGKLPPDTALNFKAGPSPKNSP